MVMIQAIKYTSSDNCIKEQPLWGLTECTLEVRDRNCYAMTGVYIDGSERLVIINNVWDSFAPGEEG